MVECDAQMAGASSGLCLEWDEIPPLPEIVIAVMQGGH